ncbi:cytochrome P450 2J4-like isoform X2 [Carettochelys insculpta]|uniref:cytochrome P450 2J4-like isoform X2 n=1 Tax=Carettochelys insculpta TaxID=44489 RepID=UPI003EB96490
MLGISELLVALVTTLFIVQFLKLKWACSRLPPGPTPLPFIGALWMVDFAHPDETFTKIYGNIFTVWLGHRPAIVLNGFQTLKDGLIVHSEDVSGRPKIPFFQKISGGKGIIFSNGHTWKQQRRFGLMALRNMGLGKKAMEQRIQEEAHHLVEHLLSKRGEPLDPSFHIFYSVSNVTVAVLSGHRFSPEDKYFLQLIENFDNLIKFGGSLSEVSKADPQSTFDEDNLVQTVFDLFLAGTETTTTTMCWAILLMILYPDIQEKVQKELDAVLGASQLICYEDRKKLPYTNAVIHEIQRYSKILPLGVPRECVKDTVLQGYHIEKGTVILPHLTSALFDPKEWETPQLFNPHHFLTQDGNFVSKEAFLPFSAGHRVCLGEQLARTEIFIFFANLLRVFTLHLPEGVKEINTESIMGGTLRPHPYKVCAVPR